MFKHKITIKNPETQKSGKSHHKIVDINTRMWKKIGLIWTCVLFFMIFEIEENKMN